MVKINVSFMPKTHKGRGKKIKSCLRAFRHIFYHCKTSKPFPRFRVSPYPYMTVWSPITPLMDQEVKHETQLYKKNYFKNSALNHETRYSQKRLCFENVGSFVCAFFVHVKEYTICIMYIVHYIYCVFTNTISVCLFI